MFVNVPLPSVLEPAEKCSPRWKDEAIQNGNISPPSLHCFLLLSAALGLFRKNFERASKLFD